MLHLGYILFLNSCYAFNLAIWLSFPLSCKLLCEYYERCHSLFIKLYYCYIFIYSKPVILALILHILLLSNFLHLNELILHLSSFLSSYYLKHFVNMWKAAI